MTESEQKRMYDAKPKIFPEDERFGEMMASAVRYALGRMSYIVGDTVGYIKPLVPYLSDKTLDVISTDIENHADFYDLGMEQDKEKWLDLYATIKAEIANRKEKRENA